MYCSNCGTQIKPELNYCNRCGTKVFKIDSEMQKSISENLTASLGYIGSFGLVGFIFVALILVKNAVPEKALILVSFFYLAALFGICLLIILNLPGKLSAGKKDADNGFQPNQLGSANTAQLEEPKQAPASVAENTTRTLDEVLVERK